MDTLEVLHWNDTRGQYDDLARLSAHARQLRAAAGHPTVLLDAGDVEESVVRLSALTYGVSGWRVLRGCGVDAAAVGDGGLLRYGPGRLSDYAEAFGAPLLMSNIDRHSAAPEGTARSRMLRAGDLLVGVIGATTWLPPYASFGLEQRDTVQRVLTEARLLRGGGADVVILISHCGVEADREHGPALVGAVDLIVGGGSRIVLPEGDRSHGVPIVQAGTHSELLGRVLLDITDGAVSVVSMSVEPPPADIEPDPAVLTALRESEDAVAPWLAEPIATLPHAFAHSLTGHSALVGLIAQALLAYVPADLAMTLGAIGHAGLPAGPITRADVLAAAPTPANPASATLTGGQVRAMVQRGRSPDYTDSPSEVFRGRPFGLLHLANAAMVEDRIIVGGIELQDEHTFRVVATDVELGRWGELLDGELDDLVVHPPIIVPELLEAYLIASYG